MFDYILRVCAIRDIPQVPVLTISQAVQHIACGRTQLRLCPLRQLFKTYYVSLPESALASVGR